MVAFAHTKMSAHWLAATQNVQSRFILSQLILIVRMPPVPAIPTTAAVRGMAAFVKHGSERPHYTTNTEDFGRPLERDENETMHAFVHAMGFDDFFFLANGDMRAGTVFPPTGYVATVFENAPFVRDAFSESMFRGMARCRVRRTREGDVEDAELTDAERDRMRRGLNTSVRDLPSRNGLPALGPGGWIGLYSSPSAKSGGDDMELWLIVVAGMDSDASTKFMEEMRRLPSSTTMIDVFAPAGDLVNGGTDGPAAKYRHGAVRARAGLLAAAVQAMGLDLHEDEVMADDQAPYPRPPRVDDADGITMERTRAALEWAALETVPIGYVLPMKTPKDCAPCSTPGYRLGAAMAATSSPMVQRFPQYVSTARDVVFHDVRRVEGGKLVLYAGCSPTSSSCGAPVLMGPARPIIVVNPSGAPWTNTKFGSFPSEPRFEPDVSVAASQKVTWESPDVLKNRQVHARYTFIDPKMPSDKRIQAHTVRYGQAYETGGQTKFMPMVVRASVQDVLGQAFAPPELVRLPLGVDDVPYSGV